MEEEKGLSGEESLQLINRVIHEARGYFYESGIAALIYGFSVLICSLLTYAREMQLIRFPFLPLYIMVPVFFVQAWVQLKGEQKKKAKTFTDETIDFVWLGFFLSVIISLAGAFAGAGYVIVTIILFLAGFAAFLTGMIAKFRYHVICGVFCLLIAAGSFFTQNPNIYFLLALVSLIVWIIPGFILRTRFKRETHE